MKLLTKLPKIEDEIFNSSDSDAETSIWFYYEQIRNAIDAITDVTLRENLDEHTHRQILMEIQKLNEGT